MTKYEPKNVESKWQKKWEEAGIYSPDLDSAKKPFYNLMMFPYPSAEGLHVGNMYAFTGSDIYGRFKRMQSWDVFEPIGLDGFGIHSENYAIKVGRHPKEQAKISEANFYRQLRATGNAYDWKRTVETYDPDYYKWTQWIFIQLFKKGLAYRKKAPVNFCPKDKTVLADEQVVDGKCERCGSLVEKKELEQWFFKITAYADRLLLGLEKIDWSERVKIAQRQWIGRSEGARIEFKVKSSKFKIEVFTTRPDTLYGATFMVLAPEHEIAAQVPDKKVQDYIKAARAKTDQERVAEGKEKTGVDTGLKAVNPVNGEEIPVWIADYVLISYGTGAIMAVPAHDERDFEFAKKYKLPIREVIKGEGSDIKSRAYVGEGVIVNSGQWNGWQTPQNISEVINWLEQKGVGRRETTYHLRDWLISRQRYWGPPIPMVNCPKCSWQPVKDEDLPVLLPDVADWKPKGTGQSPLASVASFVKTKCPKCDGEADRETDVSDTFLDSSWYFLRYLSTDISNKVWDEKRAKKWLPVDMYIGGAEHAVLHLLYTRFLTMVFYDLGLVDFEEPFTKFRAHGLLISGGAKMSKSKGNIVSPDAYIAKYGADCLRMYLMFCGNFQAGGDFRDTGIEGMHRFLKRVWRLVGENGEGRVPSREVRIDNGELSGEEAQIMHATIKKMTGDIEELSYNTAIAALMIWVNSLEKRKEIGREELETLLKLLAPFAPHMCEELWEILGNKASIHQQSWPKYDPKLVLAKEITLIVQVNGKVRDKIEVEAGLVQKDAEKLALSSPRVQNFLGNKKPQKIIFVPDRLINVVV